MGDKCGGGMIVCVRSGRIEGGMDASDMDRVAFLRR